MYKRQKRAFSAIIELNRFGEDGHIPRFPDIGAGAGDQPQRIVIEAAADVRIAGFGQRLILMISAAVVKLYGGDIQDAFPCPLRNQMDEAQQIRTGIPKACLLYTSKLKKLYNLEKAKIF